MADVDDALESLYNAATSYDLVLNNAGEACEILRQALDRQTVPEYPSPLPDVTRFEVIDQDGRAYVEYGVQVSLSFQDDGQTLKAFVTEGPDPVDVDIQTGHYRGEGDDD